MNEKIAEHIEECAHQLVHVIMDKLDKDFDKWPEDPFLKGEAAKKILQISTLFFLSGMRHPDSSLHSLVKEYCTELWELYKDGNQH